MRRSCCRYLNLSSCFGFVQGIGICTWRWYLIQILDVHLMKWYAAYIKIRLTFKIKLPLALTQEQHHFNYKTVLIVVYSVHCVLIYFQSLHKRSYIHIVIPPPSFLLHLNLKQLVTYRSKSTVTEEKQLRNIRRAMYCIISRHSPRSAPSVSARKHTLEANIHTHWLPYLENATIKLFDTSRSNCWGYWCRYYAYCIY